MLEDAWLRTEDFPVRICTTRVFASRTAQILFDTEKVKLQHYVNDPALAMVGTQQWVLEGTIRILWWLLFGFSVSWRKWFFTDSKTAGHDRIGAHYNFGMYGPTMEFLEHN